MNTATDTASVEEMEPGVTGGTKGIVADWSSDQVAFRTAPWGKAMMWIFLLSDTFIFSIFLKRSQVLHGTTG